VPASRAAAVAAAKAAFPAWAKVPAPRRGEILLRAAELLLARKDRYSQDLTREMGKPLFEAGGDIVEAIGMAQYAGSEGRRMHGVTTPSELPNKFQLSIRQPIGVVGMITPWNWPLNQIALKVAPALAAGDTMVLKPSEECPTNAKIFAEILDAAGVPPGVFNLVQGDGPTTGNAISSHPDVEMVSFTGSTRAGIQVAIAAAPTVKRVHQELGGKSPNLVLPDADLATQLPAVAMGPLVNTGQSCISPTKVLVAKDREAEVVSFYKNMYSATPVGDPMAEGNHLGPMVNKAQFEKVRSLIQSAIDEGAKLETGGPDLPSNVIRGYYIQPTVFSGVTPDMRIANEEIFGPVATIMTYDTLDQGIELANATEYGLSAAITGDPAKAASVAGKLRAGMVAINNWGPTPGAPFGGYKQSGNGREGGLAGLKDFMEMKAISGLPA